MKTLTISALLLSALAVAQPALAGSKSASFQASFTVVEACAVETAGKQPSVHCQFSTPYSVAPQQSAATETAAAPQAPVQDASQSKVWTVTF